MNCYQKIISEATGITNVDDLEAIEDEMRARHRYGTLDHLTRGEIESEARLIKRAFMALED